MQKGVRHSKERNMSIKNAATMADARVIMDGLADADPRSADRARTLPLLGWLVGGAISFPLWAALGVISWVVFFR